MNTSERIERLKPNRFLQSILLLLGIGWAFDAAFTGMASGIAASIKVLWQLDKTAIGLYSSIAMLGMALGAGFSGSLSDKFGRKKMVLGNMLLFSMGSILGGFAWNYPSLLVTRFITGIGIGGYLPTASAMLSEFIPTKIRGRYGVLLESFWAWGWIFNALVAYLLIPTFGFRSAQFTAIIPFILVFWLYKVLPESPRFLTMNGKTKEADELLRHMEKASGITDHPEYTDQHTQRQKFQLSDLFSKKYRRSTIVLWVLWFGINFGYYGFVMWTPTLLIDKGFDMVKSFEMTLVMCLAQLPGYYSAAFLVEKIGRKKLLTIYLVGTAVASWLYGHSSSVTEIYLYGSLLYFFALGAWGSVYAYTPEVYPTYLRGSGTGWASSCGRIGAFSAPYVVPIVYKAYGAEKGFVSVFIVMMSVFLVTSVVVLLFGKETMGRTLESIEQDEE